MEVIDLETQYDFMGHCQTRPNEGLPIILIGFINKIRALIQRRLYRLNVGSFGG